LLQRLVISSLERGEEIVLIKGKVLHEHPTGTHWPLSGWRGH